MLRVFDSHLRMLPGVTIPTRSNFIEAPVKILISPVGTTEEAEGVGSSLTALVTPTLLHTIHLDEARGRFHPSAIWGPRGLSQKKPVLESSTAKLHKMYELQGLADESFRLR